MNNDMKSTTENNTSAVLAPEENVATEGFQNAYDAADLNIEKIIEKDSQIEGDRISRALSPLQKRLVKYFAIIFSVYQLITTFYPLNTISQRIIHLMFGLVLIFTIKPINKKFEHKKLTILDYLFIFLSFSTCIYIAFNSRALMLEKLGVYNTLEIVISCVVILLVLEATRRMFGWIMPSIAVIALLYAYFGNYIPGIAGHRGYSLSRIATTLTMWTEGILGSPLGVSATFVAIFVIFGAFLQKTDIGEYFVRVAYSMFGKVRGGPAKASVVGSGLMGSVSGSAVANVVGTGTFTIPLMKKVGFQPYFSGAVEAVASSGGQLMPPVMGATAFIMAEMVGKPYSDVVKAAIIPAFLYYAVLFYAVDVRSAKLGMVGQPPEKLEDWKYLVRKHGFLFLPLVALIVALVFFKVSTGRAALIGLLTVILVSLFNKENRLTITKVLESLEAGGYGMLDIVAVTALAGIISGVLSLTGLGLKISGLLINLAGGNLFVLLLLCMVVSLIAGMGLPIVACYLLLGVVVAPALVDMGVQVLAAHLFIFIFGIFSAITPPVAIAAYVAGGIAKADPMKTGFTAWRLALPLFLVPYAFVYDPTLIMQGAPLLIIRNFSTGIIGLFAFASALEGFIIKYHIPTPLRVILGAGALGMIIPGLWTDIIGISVIVITVIFLKSTSSKHQSSQINKSQEKEL